MKSAIATVAPFGMIWDGPGNDDPMRIFDDGDRVALVPLDLLALCQRIADARRDMRATEERSTYESAASEMEAATYELMALFPPVQQ